MTRSSSAGAIPTWVRGVLLDRNIKLYDCVPGELWSVADGAQVSIDENHVLTAGQQRFRLDHPLTRERADQLLEP